MTGRTAKPAPSIRQDLKQYRYAPEPVNPGRGLKEVFDNVDHGILRLMRRRVSAQGTAVLLDSPRDNQQ